MLINNADLAQVFQQDVLPGEVVAEAAVLAISEAVDIFVVLGAVGTRVGVVVGLEREPVLEAVEVGPEVLEELVDLAVVR